MTTKRDDLNTPTDLSPDGKRAHEAICAVLRKHGLTYTGGCVPFRSPKEWAERGEQYGTKSELVIVYDGGDVRDPFDPHDYSPEGQRIYDEMHAALRAIGMYHENCTGWYSAIYKI